MVSPFDTLEFIYLFILNNTAAKGCLITLSCKVNSGTSRFLKGLDVTSYKN